MTSSNIVNWRDLNAPKTVDPENYAYQKQATYALLFTDRFFQGEFLSEDNGHAERSLLASTAWQKMADRLVSDSQNKRPPSYRNILIAINRTPCHGIKGGCTGLLVGALRDIRTRLGVERFSLTEFTLAATGIYEKGGDLLGRYGKGGKTVESDPEKPLVERYQGGCTTSFDCYALLNVGWKLKALQVGGSLSSRGGILQNFIRIAESRIAEPNPGFKDMVDRYTFCGQSPAIPRPPR